MADGQRIQMLDVDEALPTLAAFPRLTNLDLSASRRCLGSVGSRAR